MPKKQIEQIVLTDEQMREYMQQYDALMLGIDKNASLPSKAQKLYKKCHKILQDYADGSWKKQSHDNVVLDNVNSELIEDFGLKFFLELGDDGKLKAIEGTNGGKSHSLTLLKNILARIASDKQNEDNDSHSVDEPEIISDDEQLNNEDIDIVEQINDEENNNQNNDNNGEQIEDIIENGQQDNTDVDEPEVVFDDTQLDDNNDTEIIEPVNDEENNNQNDDNNGEQIEDVVENDQQDNTDVDESEVVFDDTQLDDNNDIEIIEPVNDEENGDNQDNDNNNEQKEDVIEDEQQDNDEDYEYETRIIGRKRSDTSDANQYRIDSFIASVYADMGKLPVRDYTNVSVAELINLIQKVGVLSEKENADFEKRFATKMFANENWFNHMPPKVLIHLHEYVTKDLQKKHTDEEKQSLQDSLHRLEQRMDFLINEFSQVYNHISLVDISNTPDVYFGYKKLFDLRDKSANTPENIKSLIAENRTKLEKAYTEYKEYWNIQNLSSKDASHLEDRLDKIQKQLHGMNISDSYLRQVLNYQFVDANGNPKAQFIDSTGKDVIEYTGSEKVKKDSNLANIIELAKQSVSMRHLDGKKVSDKALQQELDEEFIIHLYSIAKNKGFNAIIKEKIAHPENINPDYDESVNLAEIEQELQNNGGVIDEQAFDYAMENQCNHVAGFAQCVDAETRKENEKSKAGHFFRKLFKPIQNIDKRAQDRITPNIEGRGGRIKLLVKVLEFFGMGFLASLLLTVSASAAGAVLGMPASTIGSLLGGTLAVGFSIVNIIKWRRNRKKQGLPCTFKDFLKDPRMLAAMAPTLLMLAAFACIATGNIIAAKWLGRAAMVIGATGAGISVGKDARNMGYSKIESVVWGIAGFASTIGGGLAGRAAGTQLSQWLGEKFPDIFQHKQESTIIRKEHVYDSRTFEHAKEICEGWYTDNPAELQHRVDLINQYNANHGTTINPYRAIMLSANAGGQTFDNMGLHIDGGGVHHSGGHHTVFGAEWQHTNGYTQQDINALANLFNGGQINPQGLDIATRIDPLISIHNEAGVVPNSDNIMHHDHVLWGNYQHSQTGNTGFNTYNGGDSPFIETTIVEPTVIYTPEINPLLGTYGIYHTPEKKPELKDRPGSQADIIETETIRKKREKPVPPVPPIYDEKNIYIPFHDAKHWLEVYPRRLKKLDALYHAGPLGQKEAADLWRQIKTCEQGIRTIRNRYKSVSDEQMLKMAQDTLYIGRLLMAEINKRQKKDIKYDKNHNIEYLQQVLTELGGPYLINGYMSYSEYIRQHTGNTQVYEEPMKETDIVDTPDSELMDDYVEEEQQPVITPSNIDVKEEQNSQKISIFERAKNRLEVLKEKAKERLKARFSEVGNKK